MPVHVVIATSSMVTAITMAIHVWPVVMMAVVMVVVPVHVATMIPPVLSRCGVGGKSYQCDSRE